MSSVPSPDVNPPSEVPSPVPPPPIDGDPVVTPSPAPPAPAPSQTPAAVPPGRSSQTPPAPAPPVVSGPSDAPSVSAAVSDRRSGLRRASHNRRHRDDFLQRADSRCRRARSGTARRNEHRDVLFAPQRRCMEDCANLSTTALIPPERVVHALAQICFAGDRVSPINWLGFMSSELHRDRARQPAAFHVPHR
jgi:hypothetical protein